MEDLRGSIPDQFGEGRDALLPEGSRLLVAEYADEAFSAFHRSRGPGLGGRDAARGGAGGGRSMGRLSCGRGTVTGWRAATVARRVTALRSRCGRSSATFGSVRSRNPDTVRDLL
jgi:hypothetical protein